MKSYLYQEIYDLQSKHWWFLSKRKIVLSLVDRYMNKNKINKILDAGCGCGLMLKDLQKYGQVFGMDYSEDAIQFSKQLFQGEVKQGALPNKVPYAKESFDIILALDVIEHIEEDAEAINSLRELLVEDGIVIITVPAYMFLWSSHDAVHEHKRRYTKKELEQKIKISGFNVIKSSYYNTLLFPPIFLARFINKILKIKEHSDAQMPNKFINEVLKGIFSVEKIILKHFNMHFGVSIVMVVRKN